MQAFEERGYNFTHERVLSPTDEFSKTTQKMHCDAHDFYKPSRVFLMCHYLRSTFDNMWNENVLGNHLQDFPVPREEIEFDILIILRIKQGTVTNTASLDSWCDAKKFTGVTQWSRDLEKTYYPKVMHSRILLTVVIERLNCRSHKFQRRLNKPTITSSNFCVPPWAIATIYLSSVFTVTCFEKFSIELKATIITDCRLFLP